MKHSENVRQGIFCALTALISLSLIVTLGLIKVGIVSENTQYLGNLEVFTPYDGGLLPWYQNTFERIRVNISNTAAGQFPFYLDILKSDVALQQQINQGFYDLTLPDYGLVPLRRVSAAGFFLFADHSTLVSMPHHAQAIQRLEKTAQLFNQLANQDRYALSVYCVGNLSDVGLLADASPYFQEAPNLPQVLLAALDTKIAGGALAYTDVAGYQRYFFSTDHHWNYRGAYQGYLDCWALLNSQSPLPSPPRDYGEILTAVQYEFRGSLARQAAYADVSDQLFTYDIELPPYQVSFNQGAPTAAVYAKQSGYLAGVYPAPTEFQGLYTDFFRYDCAEVAYTFPDNRTGRNLLIVGDSITNCMEELLASHFDNTWSVDLRHNTDFSLDRFTVEHGVTDVLFLNTTSMYLNYGDSYSVPLGVV